MRPRTKNQREVESLRGKLPPINDRHKQWAKDNCFQNIGYLCKGEIWCSHCGGVHIKPIPELGVALKTETKTECPYCHTMLKLENSRAKKKKLHSVMTIVTTIGGWQVLRHITIIKYLYKISRNINADKMNYFICECVQQWINKDGDCVVVALPRWYGNGVYSWLYSKKMSIKDISMLYSYEQDMYNVQGEIYPIKRVIPIIKRNGYDGYIPRTCSIADIFQRILNSCEAETLIKAKQYMLLEWMNRRGGMPLWLWDSIKIAIRNKYRIDKPSIWYDMMDALYYLRKDLKNSFYVCPKNLDEAHDKWIKQKEKVKRKKEKEEKAEKIRKYEDNYRHHKLRFFGLFFASDGITIQPIKSVKEMQEEGEYMHHCVFSNGYYKKKDSLILSAKNEDGERLETIEVLLNTGKVNQCFGKFNKFTEHHEKILKIVNDNMNQIMKAV